MLQVQGSYTANLGWRCPGCARCFSPSVQQCDTCGVPAAQDKQLQELVREAAAQQRKYPGSIPEVVPKFQRNDGGWLRGAEIPLSNGRENYALHNQGWSDQREKV